MTFGHLLPLQTAYGCLSPREIDIVIENVDDDPEIINDDKNVDDDPEIINDDKNVDEKNVNDEKMLMKMMLP